MPEEALNTIDLFSGCGGLTLGFARAGFHCLLASDIDENCEATFTANFPATPFLRGDISDFRKEDFDAVVGSQQVDVVIGGPPCQGFSLANKNRNKVSEDPRNKLFYQFVKVINWYNPRAFVMENVKGLLSMQKGKVAEQIVHEFENAGQCGYDVRVRTLHAVDYGVPQLRERVIIIGTRRDLELIPQFPLPTVSTPRTVEEAISDLPQILSGEGTEPTDYAVEPKNDYQRLMRSGSTAIFNHIAMKHTPRLIARFHAIKPGQSLVDVWETHGSVKRGHPTEKSTVKFGQNNQRVFADKPAPTIAASFQSNFVHPHLDRNFTAREGARLQSFPDSFVFKGMRTKMSWEKGLSQYQQIGNAVPPLLAYAIARQLKETLQKPRAAKILSDREYMLAMEPEGEYNTEKKGK